MLQATVLVERGKNKKVYTESSWNYYFEYLIFSQNEKHVSVYVIHKLDFTKSFIIRVYETTLASFTS